MRSLDWFAILSMLTYNYLTQIDKSELVWFLSLPIFKILHQFF